MKIDSDIEMIIENLESRGVIVDKLLYQHLMKIDSRIRSFRETGRGGQNLDLSSSEHVPRTTKSTADQLEELGFLADGELKDNWVMPKPKLERPTSEWEVKKCPRCQSSMVRHWFQLKCVNDNCKYLE